MHGSPLLLLLAGALVVNLDLHAADASAAAPAKADWPQWMGPGRNGVAAPSLGGAHNLAAKPQLVWSHVLAEEELTDYSSPLIAEGRVCVLGMGVGFAAGEALSLDKEAWTAHVASARDRQGGLLAAGTQTALAALAGNKFESLSALRETLKTAGYPDPSRLDARAKFITANRHDEHVLRCWELQSGKELWKQVWPSRYPHCGPGSTPAYAGQRLFVMDGNGVARGFSADTGQPLWERKIGPGTWYFPDRHSPLVVGDKVIYQAVPLVALEAATGKVVWQQKEVADSHSSPALWVHEGKPYVICSRFTGGRKGAPAPTNRLFCVDAADGRIVWQVPECSTEGSPSVAGDFVSFTKGAWLRQGYQGKGELSVWRLVLDKPERLADVPLVCGHSTPATDGQTVWALGTAGNQVEAIAFDLAQRTVVSRCVFKGRDDGYTSPVLADGHLLLWSGARMHVLDARTLPLKVLAEHELAKGKWSTPAYANGYLVTRGGAVNCYLFGKD